MGKVSRSRDGGDSKVQTNGRKRNRCWMFTVPLPIVDGDSEEQPGGFDDSKIWDPNGVFWDPTITRYVSCQLERCPSTGRLHWQGYIELLAAVGLQRVKQVLDCNWSHLEVRMGTQEQAISYCNKDDSAVLDEDGAKICFSEGQPAEAGKRGRGTKNESYAKALQSGTYQEAMQILQELEPADYVRFSTSVKRGLMDHFLKLKVFIRPMESFNRPRIEDKVLKTLAVVLTGASGTGKTAFALAHFSQPVLISHIDQLKDYNPLVNDGIVFDDMSFEHYPVESCIHFVDLEYDRTIHCRHVTGLLPAGMPRIFTSNRAFMNVFNFKDANEEQCKALSRRIYHELINKSLF